MAVPNPNKETEQIIVFEPMVGWFDPAQLVRTGIRALLGTLFGAYADRREVQAALQAGTLEEEAGELARFSSNAEIWIDYVSDLGDGWDATYSIAWLLSQKSLTLDGVEMPRGRLLVMGGDQVYPTAKRETYQNRFRGPYTAALPRLAHDCPDLYALPGNHDWYDGLSSFLKLFCQQRWIGGRRTHQRRSYFALQLPHHWWLWAVDIQLEADIDDPQKRYFEYFAKKLGPDDRVILCTPTSSWVDAGDPRRVDDPDALGAHPNLTYVEAMIRGQNAEVVLSLAGDLHHYSHYEHASGSRHKFTAGGGGAFLRGTHDLPPELTLAEGQEKAVYRRTKAYPGESTSQRLRWKNLLFFLPNPAFATFVGFVYLFYAWIWQSASKVLELPENVNSALNLPPSLMEALIKVPPGFTEFFCVVLPDLYRTLAHRPGTLLVTLFVPVGLYFFASPPARKWAGVKRALWGPGHGIAHLFLGAALLWLFAHVNLVWLLPAGKTVLEWMDNPWQVLLFTVEMLVSGFLLGGALTGLYMTLSNVLSGLHADEVYSSLHIKDYKNFLRMHLGPDGLTVYPIAVARVCRKWRLNPAATAISKSGWRRRIWKFRIDDTVESPWFEPRSGSIPFTLIEGPVHISGKKGRSDAHP
jgi:hypothetical protein